MVLIVVASLILAKSFLLIITASFWLFFSVFPLIALSSSNEITPDDVLTALAAPFPPNSVSSTYEFFDLWLALDPICDC